MLVLKQSMIKKDIVPAFVQAILYWIALAVFKTFLHFKVEGQENLKEVENGPIIFASNHASYIDGGISAVSLPRSSLWPKKFFPIRFLAIERFFTWKYFPINIIYWLGGAIKISNAKTKIRNLDNSHLFEVLSEPIKLLKNGAKIWIYPEGGFNDDGTPKKPRNGITFLHQQTGAPIVPVAIIGSDKVLYGNIFTVRAFLNAVKSLLMMNKVKVLIGKPIYSINGANLDENTNFIMNEIYKLKNGVLDNKI